MCRKALRRLTSRGDDAVHDHARRGHNHHEAGLNDDGSAKTVHGFHGDPKRDGDEGGGVDEGSEDAGALIAEGASVVGGARLKIDGGKTEEEGEKVGDVVAGFGEQRQRVSAQTGDEGDDDVGQGGGQRDAQDQGCAVCTFVSGRWLPMHSNSVTGVGYARKAGTEPPPRAKIARRGPRQRTRDQEGRDVGSEGVEK